MQLVKNLSKYFVASSSTTSSHPSITEKGIESWRLPVGTTRHGGRPKHKFYQSTTSVVNKNFTSKKEFDLTITSQNVRSSSSNFTSWKRDELEAQLKNNNIYLSCLQETGSVDNTRIKINSSLLFEHGCIPSANARGGVGILLSRQEVKDWENAGFPKPFCSGEVAGHARIIGIELLHYANKVPHRFFVLSVYFPCSSYKDANYEAAWKIVCEILSKHAQCTPILFCDLNTSLGTDTIKGSVIGPFGSMWINDRGRNSINYLRQHKMYSISGFLKKIVMLLGFILLEVASSWITLLQG